MGLRFQTWCLGVLCVFSLVVFPGATGCGKSLLADVGFAVEPNLETAKVQLNFSDRVQSDLGGSFDIVSNGRNYGTIEVQPSTPSTPFNVGFRVNLDIVNDQDFAKLEPVLDLPSGQPIPVPNLNRAFAKVALKNEVSPKFDVYAYVDVVGKEWVGLALTLKFLNNKYFPAGLSVSKGFIKGRDGSNRTIGAVFGPKVDENGNLAVPGGIALFANVRGLLTDGRAGSAPTGLDGGEKFYIFQGPGATHYNTHPEDAEKLSETFIELMRLHTKGRTGE